MSTKENFVKALRELTGFEGDAQESDVKNTEVPKAKKLEPIKFEYENKVEDLVVKETQMKETRTDAKHYTMITKGMLINGKVEAEDRIEVFGRIEGEVTTKNDLVVCGAIIGDVRARNFSLNSCAVKGNIYATGDVLAETNSIIIGDISAENIKLDGKVKGNITIQQMAELTENALISGNIETNGISTSRGSRIKGNIITREANDFDDDKEFDIEV